MNKIFFFFLNIFIIKIIKGEYEKCKYSFLCSKEEMGNICLKKIRTNSNNIFNIIINSYLNSSCNVYNSLISDKEENIKYIENNGISFKRPSYPNGYCYNNSQCLNGICKNNICVNYNKCFTHGDCPFNTFCDNGECKNYLEDNDKCEESYQCKFDSFCDLKDKTCKKLFYFEDGEDISEFIEQNEIINIGEICKSGGYIQISSQNKEETKYYCETLFNDNLLCKNKCIYKRKSNNESFTLNDKCLCGYNKYRNKYCVLGNGEKEYIEYLEKRKEFLFNENYIKNCHTLERDSNEICNELINLNNTVSFRQFVQEYTNLKIKALEYHRIKDSESCIKEVIFGYRSNPIIPLKQTCPRYICDDNIKQCLYGINSFNENGNNITIKLNNKICNTNELCTINNGLLASNDIMNIMEKENIEGKCSIYFYWPSIRYPGEKCNIDSDCKGISRCINGKCSGGDNGQSCSETYECKVGHYCNKELSICIPQKKEGEPCTEGWDCQNFLGCYRGRCIKFGMLKPGVLNSEKNAPFPGDERRYYLCTTGELDGDDGKTGNYCAKSKYSEEWINREGKEIDKNGFIKCEYKESCFYDNGKRTVEKICECGYNGEGQGYCPLPSSLRMDDWNERVKFIANFANNNCHTLSRFNCYLQNSLEDFKQKKEYDKKTISAHLFYKALPCAEKMFSYQKYLYINSLILLILCILFS